MIPEIWEPNLTVVFVGSAVDEVSDTLGFYFLHPRNRFWELLELAGIADKRIISAEERKALSDGHKDGSLSDPVRSMFMLKKTSQLLRLGIGFTNLNRRVVALNDKDKTARPTEDDVLQFVARVKELNPKIVAFVTSAEIVVESFAGRYRGASGSLGQQAFRIGDAEVWTLGSTGGMLRGEALTMQEDVFFALGERMAALRGDSPS